MILMIATVLAIDQTCFSDAIVFLWGVLFELFKQAFSVGDVYPYPTPSTWEKQIKKRKCGLFKSISGFCEKGHDPN